MPPGQTACAASPLYVTFTDFASENVVKNDISGAQLRAARALIDWSRETLAEKCGCATRTLLRIEAGETLPQPRTAAALRAALESAGVEFISQNGGGPGVRLRDANAGNSPLSSASAQDVR